jgi:hypothetical protein
MATEITMHPSPTPVKLHPKVVKGIAIEATMDVDWEGMHEDDPASLIETYERIGADIEYIRLLLSGELTEAWAVLQCEEQLSQESDRIAGMIGAELLRLDRFKGDKKVVTRREVERTIKRLRKQAKWVWADWRKCRRFWEECMEYDKDQEAAQRLGLSEGDQ